MRCPYRRLSKEAEIYNHGYYPGISIFANGKPWDKTNASSLELLVLLEGPQGTPYEKYKLKVVISFTEAYPHCSPRVFFKPPLYHVNIEQTSGQPDISILSVHWFPSCHIINILEEIIELLKNPDQCHACNELAAQEFINNRESYNRKAEKSAKISSKY